MKIIWTTFVVLDLADANIEVLQEYGTKKKILRCKFCGKVDSVKNKSTLRAHIETNHMPNLVYNCNDCDKVYKSYRMFQAHRKKH